LVNIYSNLAELDFANHFPLKTTSVLQHFFGKVC
jgi:hypothetical protein